MSTTSLVTGAGGLIGAALCRELIARGDRVIAVRRTERRASSDGRLPGPMVTVAADVRERNALALVLAEQGPVDAVYHLAAQSTIGEAARRPLETLEINVAGTCQVLEACRRHGVRRVVVASSDKVYGAGAPLPTPEEAPLNARDPYEVSKVAADLLARSYWESFGLPVAVARLSNVFGGGDLNFSRLVPHAVTAALEGRPPRLRAPRPTERDFMYVDDAVGAYLAIGEALPDGGAAGEAYNAGTGRARSTLEVARAICRLAGTGVEPEHAPEAGTLDVDRECIDPGKLEGLTGWRAEVDLEDGLARTIEWYREHAWARPEAESAPGAARPGS